jgi:hypothetical protein
MIGKRRQLIFPDRHARVVDELIDEPVIVGLARGRHPGFRPR